MTTIDQEINRVRRGHHAAVSGHRAGRMLAVTAHRLPGAGSSFALIAVPLLATVIILAVRHLARRVSR